MCGFVAKRQNHVILTQLVIKAVAAVQLVVIMHVEALCKSVLEVIGNQAMAALEALIQAAQMVLSLNGAGKATACTRLAFVAKVK